MVRAFVGDSTITSCPPRPRVLGRPVAGLAAGFTAFAGAGAGFAGAAFAAGFSALGAGFAGFAGVLGAGFFAAGAGFALAAVFGAGLAAFVALAGAGFFAGAGFEPAFDVGLEAFDLAAEAAFLVDMDRRDVRGNSGKILPL